MESRYEFLGFKRADIAVNQYGIKIYLGTKYHDDWCMEIPKRLILLEKTDDFRIEYFENKHSCPMYGLTENQALDIATKYTNIAKRFEMRGKK